MIGVVRVMRVDVWRLYNRIVWGCRRLYDRGLNHVGRLYKIGGKMEWWWVRRVSVPDWRSIVRRLILHSIPPFR